MNLPLVFVIFVLFLVCIYLLIMGVECCDYCKSQRQDYTEVEDDNGKSGVEGLTV